MESRAVPLTVDEVIEDLVTEMHALDLGRLGLPDHAPFITLHFGLGMVLRNRYFWKGPGVVGLGPGHPDDLSHALLGLISTRIATEPRWAHLLEIARAEPVRPSPVQEPKVPAPAPAQLREAPVAPPVVESPEEADPGAALIDTVVGCVAAGRALSPADRVNLCELLADPHAGVGSFDELAPGFVMPREALQYPRLAADELAAMVAEELGDDDFEDAPDWDAVDRAVVRSCIRAWLDDELGWHNDDRHRANVVELSGTADSAWVVDIEYPSIGSAPEHSFLGPFADPDTAAQALRAYGIADAADLTDSELDALMEAILG